MYVVWGCSAADATSNEAGTFSSYAWCGALPFRTNWWASFGKLLKIFAPWPRRLWCKLDHCCPATLCGVAFPTIPDVGFHSIYLFICVSVQISSRDWTAVTQLIKRIHYVKCQACCGPSISVAVALFLILLVISISEFQNIYKISVVLLPPILTFLIAASGTMLLHKLMVSWQLARPLSVLLWTRSPPIVRQAKRRATKIRPKSVGSDIFGRIPNSDKCRSEVAGDVIPGADVD